MRVLNPSLIEQVEGRQRGLISWEADPFKSIPGSITLLENSTIVGPTTASFLHADIDKSGRRVVKGDEVEFDLFILPDTHYAKATNIRVVRTRRDRVVQEQIQMFEEAGVKMEQGIIDTIKGREFGFIRSCDRPEQIYFRLDDMVQLDTPTLEVCVSVGIYICVCV